MNRTKAVVASIIAAVALASSGGVNTRAESYAPTESATGYATPYWRWETQADVWTRKMYLLHDFADQLRAAGYSDDSNLIKTVSAEWWREKNDLDMIAKTVYSTVGTDKIADADNEVQQQAMNYVAQVVVNRVKDQRFPDTVYGVLTSGGYDWSNTTGFDGVPLSCYFAAVTALDGNAGISSEVVYQESMPDAYKDIVATFHFRSGERISFCR